MNKIFSKTGSLRPGRSVFNLSYEKKFTCDMGQLIPVMADEVIPGDVFKIGAELVIRFQPLVAPILHEINAYIHYFFVPYRLLDSNFEEFITGGTTGESAVSLTYADSHVYYRKGYLGDYIGFPILNVDGTTTKVPTGSLPLAYPIFAYNLIWNEYYRDQNLQAKKAIGDWLVKLRAWEKDYFTSALPWQQRGTAPALPVTGTGSLIYNVDDIEADDTPTYSIGLNRVTDPSVDGNFTVPTVGSALSKQALVDALHKGVVNFDDATTFDVSDMRTAFQIQKWLERNARAGARYTEFLRAHYGVSPRDERLQRPEYIGGMRTPVIISEVLQTSSTDAVSAQGNLAGHGLTVDRKYIGTYKAKEFGLIMGILSVMPRAAYQQGIDRQWLKRTKYDFYSPEFAFLSEQAIEKAEIYATEVEADNIDIFGYQGRYNELRYKRNMVVGEMRDTFDYWHLGRQFSSSPELNGSFIECVPRKDIFAAPNEKGLIVSVGNIIKAIRPIPYTSEPGLVDH